MACCNTVYKTWFLTIALGLAFSAWLSALDTITPIIESAAPVPYSYKAMYEFRMLLQDLEATMKYLKRMFNVSKTSLSQTFLSDTMYRMLKASLASELAVFPFEQVEGMMKTYTMKHVTQQFKSMYTLQPLFRVWHELCHTELLDNQPKGLVLRSDIAPLVSAIDPRDIQVPGQSPNNLDQSVQQLKGYTNILRDITMFVSVLEGFIVRQTKWHISRSPLNRNGIVIEEPLRIDDFLATYEAFNELPIKDMVVSTYKAVRALSIILSAIQAGSGLTLKEWFIKECLNQFPIAVYVVIVNTVKIMNEDVRPRGVYE